METPPEFSVDNVDEIMKSLDTSQETKNKVSENVAAGVYTKYDALYNILCEWVARKSSNATLEVLIFDLKKRYLNSYADGLELMFMSPRNRKISNTPEFTPENYSDYDCYSTVNSNQPFFKPDSVEISEMGQQTFKTQSQMCILPCMTVILLSLTATLFVIMLQNFGLFQKNKPSTNDTSYNADVLAPNYERKTETTGFIISNFSSEVHDCATTNGILYISVTTYDEFIQATSNISNCDSISLHIDLSSRDAWPQKPNIISARQITEVSLSGEFGIGKVMGILQSVQTMNVLRLNNSQNKLCSENSHHNSLLDNVRECDVNLSDLHYLHFHNFVNCEHILDMILTCLKLKMSVFEFNGEITNENAQQIFHIMQGSHNTMKEIKISGTYATSLSILPIHTPMHSLGKLSIVVEPKNEQFKHATIISEHFCKTFAKINTFIWKGPIATYEQLIYLQNCKELTEIVVSVNLRATDDIEVLNLSEWFPLLIRLDIELTFQECPDVKMSDMLIRKMRQIRRTCVCSNCELLKTLRRGSKNNAQKICLNLNTIA